MCYMFIVFFFNKKLLNIFYQKGFCDAKNLKLLIFLESNVEQMYNLHVNFGFTQNKLVQHMNDISIHNHYLQTVES